MKLTATQALNNEYVAMEYRRKLDHYRKFALPGFELPDGTQHSALLSNAVEDLVCRGVLTVKQANEFE